MTQQYLCIIDVLVPIMVDNDSTNSMKLSRRSLLKTSAAAITLTGSSGIVQASEPTIEVPIAKSGDEVILSAEVPENWWRHIQRTRAAENALRRELGVDSARSQANSETIRSIHRTPLESGNAKNSRWKLVVGVNQEVNGNVQLPDDAGDLSRGGGLSEDLSGIPIEKKQYGQLEKASFHCEHEDVEYDMRGGYNFGDAGGNGTAACRVSINSQNNDYMITAAHLWESLDPNDNITEGEEADNGSEKFGEVSQHFNSNIDYALIEKTTSDYSFNSNIGPCLDARNRSIQRLTS